MPLTPSAPKNQFNILYTEMLTSLKMHAMVSIRFVPTKPHTEVSNSSMWQYWEVGSTGVNIQVTDTALICRLLLL